MIDVTDINTSLFCAASASALSTRFPEVVRTINSEHEYDNSGEVPFLPLDRLNSRQERAGCLHIISEISESGLFTHGPFPFAGSFLPAQ